MRSETLSEPAVYRSKKSVRFFTHALIAPKARCAHCRTQFPGLGLLRTRNGERTFKKCFRSRRTELRQPQRDFAAYAIDLCFVPAFIGRFHRA